MKWIYKKLKSLFATETQISYDKSTHITYLIIILCFLITPFFILYSPNKQYVLSIFSIDLPGTCLSRALFNTECPGCGMTRAFVLITHGHFKESMAIHRLAPLLYIFFIYLVIYKIYCICNPGKKLNRLFEELQFLIPFLVICLLVLNWIIGIYITGN